MCHPCEELVPLTFQVVPREVMPRFPVAGVDRSETSFRVPLGFREPTRRVVQAYLPSLLPARVYAASGDSDLSSISLLSLILQLQG